MIQQREFSLHATTIERSNGLGADIGLFGHRQGLLMLWLMGLAVVCVRLLAFPLLPVDETRYLSVAWEMHQSSNWLVPHINGEPYPQKPPLMFWLLNIGWLMGIGSDFLSRLVVPMAGLMNVLALRALIVSVAPRQQQLAALSPWLLLGAFSWQVFMALTMFDMLVCLFLLLALTSLFKAQQNRYWAVVSGIAVGLGMLTKGPVFLLYWLPIGLSAFYWRPEHLALKRWYQGLAMATVVGIAVILAWAIPAAMAGGSDYAQAIFWRQSAGRVANAFAHTRPWYWYLTLLPLFLLPWVAMPFWKGRIAAAPWQRFVLCGFLPQLVLFSIISSKQLHYLIPTFPFAAVWLAGKWLELPGRRWGFMALLVAFAAAIGFLPELLAHSFPGSAVPGAMRWMALLPLLLAAWVYRRPFAMLVAFPLTVQLLLCLAGPVVRPYYDFKPFAQQITQMQDQGTPVAYIGHYANQFRFLGRGDKDLVALGKPADVQAWASQHPQGLLVAVVKKPSEQMRRLATEVYPYRTRFFVLMPSRDWLMLDTAAEDEE